MEPAPLDNLEAVGISAQPSAIVIRPSAIAFARRAVIGLIAVWPLLAIQSMVGAHQLGLSEDVFVVASTIATLALIAAIYFLNVRVTVNDDDVIVRGMTGRERRWPRHAVQGCVLISVLLAVRPTRLAIVHSAKHRFLFSLTTDLWDDRALRALTHALGYRHHATATYRTMSKEELREQYPGAFKQVWGPSAWLRGLLLTLVLIAEAVTFSTLLYSRG